MNAHLVRSLIAIGALVVLGSINYSIYAKERIKQDGELVHLELAPVDPRSLMQGDYMALRFRLAVELELRRSAASGIPYQHGTVPLHIDARRVATLSPDEVNAALRMSYRIRNGQVWLGTNAYFFEEGTARRFAGARYGTFRVDPKSGEAVLVGLRDDHLEKL